MASSTPTPASSTLVHVRSISLPSRSHPLTVRVEEGLQRLKGAWTTTSSLPPQASSTPAAELLCVGLQALEEMYDSVEELLLLRPHAQQAAIAKHRSEEWLAEELDSSVRLLDICGSTKDAISSIKEQAQSGQSTLRTRRAGGEYYSIGQLHALVQSRKKAHKEGSKCLKALKQLDGKRPAASASPPSAADEEDLSLALRALEGLRETTIVILRLISTTFLSINKPTCRRWFPRTSELGEQQGTSELEKVEASLRSSDVHRGKRAGNEYSVHSEKVEGAQRRLQRLEAEMSRLETGLESMFRRLIQNRVSLLNILSL